MRECSHKVRSEALKLYGRPEAAVGFRVGAGGDTSKRIDVAAENAVIDCLRRHEVSCTLVSEEAGTKRIGDKPSNYYVTVDPVDGTTNAVRGVPFMCTVIAVSRGPRLSDVETALVHDLVHDKVYTAQKNRGAYLNGKRINPSDTADLKDALIGVDCNTFRIRELIDRLEGLFVKAKHFRHFGANALEICYVADGHTDAFIDIRGKLRVTDMAASQLILTEAGGIMLTPKGTELDAPLEATQRVSFIAAANSKIYEAIKEALKI